MLLALAGCGTVAPGQWQNIGPGNAQINTLASDPNFRGIIYAGDSDGKTYLARGDKAGIFAPSTTSPDRGPINVLFPNPYTKAVVYAGTAGGFYSSSDYGVNYRAQNSGLPGGANVTAITTGADAASLYISVAEKGFYTSADGGKSWKAVVPAGGVTAEPIPASATVQALVWVNASKALFAAVSGTGHAVYVSHDSGVRWATYDDGLPPKSDGFALLELAESGVAPTGLTMYAGTSSGVFALTGNTAKWAAASTGLPSGAVYSLATYAGTSGLLYAGTGQTVFTSVDGGRNWTKVAGGLAHAVSAIVVTPGQNTPTVAFAAAGQIVRYPAGQVGGGGILSTLVIVVIIGAAAWFILARYRIVPSFPEALRRIRGRGSR